MMCIRTLNIVWDMYRSAINHQQVQKIVGKIVWPIILYLCIASFTSVKERKCQNDNLTQCIFGIGYDKDIA